MSQTFFTCELCDMEFEDHALAFAPHLCEDCDADAGDLEDQLEDAMGEESV